jgi:hypothetical protein
VSDCVDKYEVHGSLNNIYRFARAFVFLLSPGSGALASLGPTPSFIEGNGPSEEYLLRSWSDQTRWHGEV